MKDVMLSERGLQMVQSLVVAMLRDQDQGGDTTAGLFGPETRMLVNEWAEEIDALKSEVVLYLGQISEIEE